MRQDKDAQNHQKRSENEIHLGIEEGPILSLQKLFKFLKRVNHREMSATTKKKEPPIFKIWDGKRFFRDSCQTICHLRY